MNEQSIFNEALDRGDPAARSAYLDEACAGDLALRERVEALLTSHAVADNFLGKLAPERIAEELKREQTDDETQGENSEENKWSEEDLGFLTPSDKPGALGRLGHYEVLEVVGQGGMGVVLRAFDDKLHRVVAIKVLLPALASSGSARQRFVREARAAAAVTHDNVIAIHAVEEAGQRPLGERCRARPAHRLRPGAGGGRRQPDAVGFHRRHAGVHVAGAGRR